MDHHGEVALPHGQAVPATMQAGGGVPEESQRSQLLHSLHETITNYARRAWEASQGQESFESFLHYLQSNSGSALAPPPPTDLSYPISNYYISSSHNTYLTGNQLTSDSSTEGYKNVLLRGCRCVEIDVWDGEDDSPSSSENEAEEGEERSLRKRLKGLLKGKSSARDKLRSAPPAAPPNSAASERIEPWRVDTNRVEPRVLHGYTATKEVPFRDVCSAIRDYAFVTSELPVIISLEVHTSLEQQAIMVEIMEQCWKDMLMKPPANPDDCADLPLPQLADLKRKILVKVKYSPPTPPAEANQAPVQEPEDTSSGSDEDMPAKVKKPKSKMLEELSRLGVYTRSYHFKSFSQPEARIPTHIFSLSEGVLMEVHESDPRGLFSHNKNFLMRAYPKGVRFSSSNLDPAVFWRKGVQIVALNWQKWDAGTMLNEAMFAGTGGWILKPEGYRGVSDATQQQHAASYANLDMYIEFFAGQDLPLPPDEKERSFKPYVKVELHVEKPEERLGERIPGGGEAREGEYKRHTATTRGCSPDFRREVLRFDGVTGVVPELSFVRFKVMDDDRMKDDLAAWACFRLDRLSSGYRMIHLFDCAGVQTKGVLFVRIRKQLSVSAGT
ncbi:hypothetical protein W97_01173 [Coniosporium apollinis CBS 100218]|uniref:Phosphoinositide phospholipase C n=1 Tax=Coniosporium apollinis (strain CBS 100218) TaxID=1168221 RepID=R7YJ72_CONA1|nr:uncharacterized protein W97_01173 [Coniosporium apollinis CBS 100218]EON61955.1 hypothetical protein W97_01173 [Coniosporium apollinis CBS 100218]